MTISAQIIHDSIWMGRRITTMQLRYPRFIHSEFMTHRAFSRNASSSRAIPFKKQKKAIWNDPATFVSWGRNKPGMAASEELTGWRRWLAQFSWSLALWVLWPVAWLMELSGVHKQVINRMLEPWVHINVLVTATEWENFFKLRLDPAAQPEMRDLALAMKLAMMHSTPVKRKWHLPFLTEEEEIAADANLANQDYLMKLSAARCARLSYLPFGSPKPDVAADLRRDKLLSDEGHMSPFEHQAWGLKTPASVKRDCQAAWRANFFGWESRRYRMEHPNPTKYAS